MFLCNLPGGGYSEPNRESEYQAHALSVVVVKKKKKLNLIGIGVLLYKHQAYIFILLYLRLYFVTCLLGLHDNGLKYKSVKICLVTLFKIEL